MKRVFFLLVTLSILEGVYQSCVAQNATVDSLLNVLKTAKEDTNKVNILNLLSQEAGWKVSNYDTAFYFAEHAKKLALKLNYKKGIADNHNNYGVIYKHTSNYPEALKHHFASLKIKEEMGDKKGIAHSYGNIGNIYQHQGNFNEALKYQYTTLKIREEMNDKAGIADSYNNIGNTYMQQGNYPETFKMYHASLKIREELGDKEGLAISIGNIAIIYEKQGNYPEALKNHLVSLKLKEELGDKSGLARSYSNIGNVYYYQGNYPDALKNYLLSLRIYDELENKRGMAICYSLMGVIYRNQGNFIESVKNQKAALLLAQQIGENKIIASAHNNLGNVYLQMSDQPGISLVQRDSLFNLALENCFSSLSINEKSGAKKGMAESTASIANAYHHQCNRSDIHPAQRDTLLNLALKKYLNALSINEEIRDKNGVARCLNSIGELYVTLKNKNSADRYLSKALEISKEIGAKELIRNSYHWLSVLDSSNAQYKRAYENYKMSIIYRDSLLNEENTKKTTQLEMQYEFDKKEAETQAEQEKKDAVAAAELKRQKQIRYATTGGLGLTLLLAASIFFSLQQNKKKNKIITAQKVEVEEKNKHITESIQYALRIQTAILPPDKLVKEHLANSFVLYLPKDIVAGDFYWMEAIEQQVISDQYSVGGEKGKPNTDYRTPVTILFAACDCTGHGVPGAMVSVMCHNALNRAVREYNLTAPAKILDKVVDLVEDNFNKSDEEIQDGMDASLCAYYPEEKKLHWAGANNPLWIVRNNEIIEYKPDKQPIGKYDYRKPYTNHEIELQKGDTIYIFSDGYHDQFGDDGEKKLTKKGLRKILLGIQDKPMNEQRAELLSLHNRWKGEVEQIDDICVIGVRV